MVAVSVYLAQSMRRIRTRDQIIALNARLRPSDDETRLMVKAVIRELGEDRALWLMGIRRTHYDQLKQGVDLPRTEYFRRSVWWAYCMVCEPGRIKSRFAALTWGRFAKRPAHQQRVGSVTSDSATESPRGPSPP